MEKLIELLGTGATWIVTKAGEGIVWLTKEGLGLIGTGAINIIKSLSGYDEVFILVATVGMLIVITGRKELGTKITSGTFISYIIAKGVKALC